MTYEVKVIADSISTAGARLTTLEVTFPRFILSEFNTHRMLCLAGDAELEFDLPTPQSASTRRVYRMRLDVFVDRWLNGAAPRMNNYGRGTNRQPVRGRLGKMQIRQFNESTGLVQNSTVVGCAFSGIKPVYEVRTLHYRVAGSTDHLVLTDQGWKTIGQLSLNDSLIVRKFGKTSDDILDPNRLRKIDGRWRSVWQREVFDKLYAVHQGCQRCRSLVGLQTHHIVPVHEDRTKAFDEINLELLCEDCHKAAHSTQGWQGGTYLYGGPEAITEIRLRGEEPTYDLEIAGEFPNFIANGVVVHNSRNSASSRAVPIAKMLDHVQNNPFVPTEWGRNQRGMQATRNLSGARADEARAIWLAARRDAMRWVLQLDTLNVHKQLANRLLEPFMWHTCVVTATEWDNFFHLRCHPDAQPEFQRIACMMRDTMQLSKPIVVPTDGWHLPYVDPSTDQVEGTDIDDMAYVSAARCARLSYLHDGSRDPKADLALSQKLEKDGHMSPFEHPAFALGSATERHGNFCGWKQLRKLMPYEHDPLAPGAHNGNVQPS